MPVDAERWLASRGIQREPLRVEPSEDGPEPAAAEPISAAPAPAAPGPMPPADLREGGTAVEHGVPSAQDPGEDVSDLTIEGALAFIRRSTTNAPQSEGRLRTKLGGRGYHEDIIAVAIERARTERLVDDAALLAALIVERRARGHADIRLRRDLRDRGFTGVQVDEALAEYTATDPAAMVFDLARAQAGRHRAIDAEAAVRRTVGFLVRRGHSEGLARKAARDAVYADREAQEVAGR